MKKIIHNSYETFIEVVRNNNLNSLEFQRALELSMVKK